MAKKEEKKIQEEAEATRKLYRQQIQGVELKEQESDFAVELERDDQKAYRDFCYYCSRVVNSPFFPLIVSQLVRNQVWFVSLEAEGDPQVFFGRGSVNGVRVLEEYFRKYAKEWEAKFTGQENLIDPHKMFDPTMQLGSDDE